ncbi:MAG: tetratricopeptide repeat protein [Elusimicrobiota bacterium]
MARFLFVPLIVSLATAAFAASGKVYFDQAFKHMMKGEHLDAIRLYRKGLALEPDREFYIGYLGDSYMELGCYSQALAQYEKRLKLETHETILSQVGHAMTALKRYSEALEYYRKAAMLDPKSYLYAFRAAGALDHLGRKEEARKVLEDFKKTETGESKVAYYLERMDKGQAVDYFDPDAKKCPLPADGTVPAGMSSASAIKPPPDQLKASPKDAKKAAQYYEKGMNIRKIAIKKNKWKKNRDAAKLFGKALALDPGNTTYLRIHAVTLDDGAEPQAARDAYARALPYFQKDFFFQQSAGKSFLEGARYSSKEQKEKYSALAASCYARVTTLSKAGEQDYINLGVALEWQGEDLNALEAYEKAYPLSRDQRTVGQWIDKLRRKLGMSTRAQDAAKVRTEKKAAAARQSEDACRRVKGSGSVSADARTRASRARGLMKARKYDEADAILKDLVKEESGYAKARFFYAVLNGRLERYAKAIEEMRCYLILEPDAKNKQVAQDNIDTWKAAAE